MHPNSSKKLLRKLRAYRLRRSFALVIGQRLIEAKARLPHGKFLPWIKEEFPEMHRATANRFMSVAEAYTLECRTVQHLSVRALYALAAPSTEAKARLPHGKFLPWIESEFGMSSSAADRFIQVARLFDGKMPNLGNLPPSALYALAAS